MRAEIVSDRGTGQPVVFVPGIDGTGAYLLGTAARLEARFRLVRVCYLDEGLPGSAVLYERLADSLAECLEAAGIERAIVLAESFGGGVALQLALRHPGRVQAMMLINTFAWFPERFRAGLGARLVPFAPSKLLRIGRNRIATRLLFRPRKDPEAERLFREAIPGFSKGGYGTRMRAIPHLDLRARLAEIPMRVELYSSSHDRVVPTQQTMQMLYEGLPNAALHIVPNANHLILPLADEPWVERLVELAAASQTQNEGHGMDSKGDW